MMFLSGNVVKRLELYSIYFLVDSIFDSVSDLIIADVLMYYNLVHTNLLVSYANTLSIYWSSHMQIRKSYVNDNEIQNQELLTLDTISPIWAKKLEESQLLPLLSLRRIQLYLELRDTSRCVVGEAYGFSSSYVSDCKRCSKIGWKFMFYFMIHSYSKLEGTKKEFVKHWVEKHHYVVR